MSLYVSNCSAVVGICMVTSLTAQNVNDFKKVNRLERGLFNTVVYLIVKTVAREACGWLLCAGRRGLLNNSPHRISVMTGFRNLQCISAFVASPFYRKSVKCDAVDVAEDGHRDLWCSLKLLGFSDEQ
jgi:hypothetical protein